MYIEDFKDLDIEDLEKEQRDYFEIFFKGENMGLKQEINEIQEKNKKINKIIRKYDIPLIETPYIVLIKQMSKKGFNNIDEFIEEYDVENNESIRDLFNSKSKYITNGLLEELDDLIEEQENISLYFYAGKDNIVLTPFYISELMNHIIGLKKEDTILDPCAGAGSLLYPALQKGAKIIGIEKDPVMWCLGYVSAILNTGEKQKIILGDAFEEIEKLEEKITLTIVNPPYQYEDKGMPFIKRALDKVEKGGRGIIIVQASAGVGKAQKTNEEILKKHTLFLSIKMPVDLFLPYASVQTSIYTFIANVPHDEEKEVTFIDFSDDGITRTVRGTTVKDESKYDELKNLININYKN